MKTKCHDKMPVRLGPEWDFSLWFALQGSLASTQFVFSRIRDQFANIQSSCATESEPRLAATYSSYDRHGRWSCCGFGRRVD
jgi:hypothetical protein